MQNKFPCWFKLQAPTIYIQINRTLQQQVMHPYCRNKVFLLHIVVDTIYRVRQNNEHTNHKYL